MAEKPGQTPEEFEVNPEELVRLHPRALKSVERQRLFNQLVLDGAEVTGETTISDYELSFFAPGHVAELFRETYGGSLIPEPGTPVIDIAINGLLGPGYYSPIFAEEPHLVLLRRSVIDPLRTDGSQRLSLVFESYQTNGGRVVTAESESGILLCNRGFRMYSVGRVLVDGEPYIVGRAGIAKCGAAAVDEFLKNIINIMGANVGRDVTRFSFDED